MRLNPAHVIWWEAMRSLETEPICEKAERELEEKLHEAYIEALKEEAELDDHRHDTSYG